MTIFEKFETQSKILNVSIFIFCRNEIKLYVVVVVVVVVVVGVVVVVVVVVIVVVVVLIFKRIRFWSV